VGGCALYTEFCINNLALFRMNSMLNKSKSVTEARMDLYKKTLSNWVDANDNASIEQFLKFNEVLSIEFFGVGDLNEYASYLKNRIDRKINARNSSKFILESDVALQKAGYQVKLSYDNRKKSKLYVVNFTYPVDFKDVTKRGATYQIGNAFNKKGALDIVSFHNFDLSVSKLD
jgi:hypothetical protein